MPTLPPKRAELTRSAVHSRAKSACAKNISWTELSPTVSLVEYEGASGCYVYSMDFHGAYRIDMRREDIHRDWADESKPLTNMRRVAEIEFPTKRSHSTPAATKTSPRKRAKPPTGSE